MSQSFRLGAFVAMGLAAFATGVFFIGREQSMFGPHYRLLAQFDNVQGLIDGADVRVGGIHKGAVRRIDLPQRPDGKVTVVMDLEKETQAIVKRDSVAAIKSQGLLGDKYVEVSFGSAEAAQVENGETVQSQPPLDISDLVEKSDKILNTAGEAMKNIQGAAGNMNQISARVNAGTGTLGALINDRAMYQQATGAVTALREDAEALKHNFLLRGFFHRRGYENAADVARDEIARVPETRTQQMFVYESKGLFDKPGSAKFKNEKTLAEAGQYLESNPFGLTVIACATGDKGDSAESRKIAQARAYVVRKYLVDNFRLDDQRIKIVGLGKTTDGNDQVQVFVYPPNSQAARLEALSSAKSVKPR